MPPDDHFRHLNADGRWPGFQWDGLERRSDGALQLFTLPRMGPEAASAAASPADAPAGIAVDRDGTIFWTDPGHDRVLAREGCFATDGPVPCIGGRGTEPARLNRPRGLVVLPHRRALLVVDAGNHRVQLFDLASFAVLDVWGSPAGVGPSAEVGRFDTPWTAAGDAAGSVYVVDRGNRRIQKFDRAGRVAPAFWETMQVAGLVTEPVDVAVHSGAHATRVYVLDAAARTVRVFDDQGHPLCDRLGAPLAIGGAQLRAPVGLAAGAEMLYVGDADPGRVRVFALTRDGVFAGDAVGYEGPVAALALAADGRLLVHTGSAAAPLALRVDEGHRGAGILWSRAIDVGGVPVRWHRLRLEADVPAGAHLELFVHAASDAVEPPVAPRSDDPFPAPHWRRFTADSTDVYLGGPAARWLRIGARLAGDGLATPVVRQMRVEYDHAGYLAHLPAIYRTPVAAETGTDRFLTRLLALFESFFGDLENAIARMPSWFDPAAIGPEYLPWLAGWLAVDLEEDWDEATQRHAVADAFAAAARRGTVEGLRASLLAHAGVAPLIEEPALHASYWVLPVAPSCGDARHEPWVDGDGSALGFTTMLAPASPAGAVVGTTAVLDRSHLIPGDEAGVALSGDVAHRFTVAVYRGQLDCAERLEALRRIVEQEKPAHTTYHLCVIEPRMRVGFQARLGVDSVVGGPAAPGRLGVADGTRGLALGGQAAGRIGERSTVGRTTRL